MKYSIKLFGMLLSVGFLAACNGVQQLNCNPDDIEIQEAAEENDIKRLDQIWSRGEAEVDANCENDCAAFVRAASKGQTRAIKWMLKKDFDPNIKNGDWVYAVDGQYMFPGDTALISATRGQHTTTVDELLRGHANCDIKNDHSGDTALHVAAHTGNLAIVSSLIRAGASLDIPNDDGDTALHVAVRQGYKQIKNFLIKKGADTTIKNNASCAAADISPDRSPFSFSTSIEQGELHVTGNDITLDPPHKLYTKRCEIIVDKISGAAYELDSVTESRRWKVLAGTLELRASYQPRLELRSSYQSRSEAYAEGHITIGSRYTPCFVKGGGVVMNVPDTNNDSPSSKAQRNNLTVDDTALGTGGNERTTDHDAHRPPVNVTVPVTNNNQQTVHVAVPPTNDDHRPDNHFNATVNPNITVNPIFHAPQAEHDEEVECCASFLRCLRCMIPFLAL